MNRSQLFTVRAAKKSFPLFAGLVFLLSAVLIFWLSYLMLDPSWVPRRRLSLLVHLPPFVRSGLGVIIAVVFCLLGSFYIRVAGGENIALISDKGIDVIKLKGRRFVLWSDIIDIIYIPAKLLVLRGVSSSSSSFHTKFRIGIPLPLVETPEEAVINEILKYRPDLIKT